jgi:hypothetical protein
MQAVFRNDGSAAAAAAAIAPTAANETAALEALARQRDRLHRKTLLEKQKVGRGGAGSMPVRGGSAMEGVVRVCLRCMHGWCSDILTHTSLLHCLAILQTLKKIEKHIGDKAAQNADVARHLVGLQKVSMHLVLVSHTDHRWLLI